MTITNCETEEYASENYFGFKINVYKINEVFGYEILSVNSYKIAEEQGFSDAVEAFIEAEERIYSSEYCAYSLKEHYGIEMTDEGETELMEFLEENFKDFDPDDLLEFVDELTDDKIKAGVGHNGIIQIDQEDSKTGSTKTFGLGDEYFHVRKFG